MRGRGNEAENAGPETSDGPETSTDPETSTEELDGTVAASPDDATIAVRVDDSTIAVDPGDEPVAVDPVDAGDATVVVSADDGKPAVAADSTAERLLAGAPLAENEEIPESLARLLFKSPLDPKRRAPESPFPKDESSLPRGGVRSGIPVVYGTRAEEVRSLPEGTDFAKWLGPPPLGYELPPADRTALVSTERMNRRFRLVALLGGAGALVVAVAGLWWVLSSIF